MSIPITQQWRQLILTFESDCTSPNPFLDVEIWAAFTGPEGSVIRREAYWDGGNTYRVAFAPTHTGLWHYTLSAPPATGLDGVSGQVECVPYTGELAIYRHGFLKVSPDRRYLTYADGTPFFWLGDTHWEFAYGEKWDSSNHPAMDSMFKGMAARRAEQGYTVYQTNLRSDSFPGRPQRYWDEISPTDLPNVAFYQGELDRRMAYLANLGLVNALGQAWFASIDGEGAVRHQKNLARYIMARYGALPLVWTLAGEVAGYDPSLRQSRIEGWREVARYIHDRDGYHTLQTAHYTNERPFAAYYQEEPWMDFTLNQAGHGDYNISAGDYRQFLQRHGDKPFIEGEALYEFVSTLEELGTRMCTPDMVRRVAYLSIQLGGCGYTYGAQGIWDDRWDKTPPEHPSIFNRFNVTWYEAIDGRAGEQMGYLRQFYERVGFHTLRPFVTEEADTNLFGKKAPAATHTPAGNKWVIYYPDSTRRPLTLTGMAEGDFSLTWFDPRSGEYRAEPNTIRPVNGRWDAPPKPGEGDWLLMVDRA